MAAEIPSESPRVVGAFTEHGASNTSLFGLGRRVDGSERPEVSEAPLVLEL